jgi:uncharacterized spore protein YtfJ
VSRQAGTAGSPVEGEMSFTEALNTLDATVSLDAVFGVPAQKDGKVLVPVSTSSVRMFSFRSRSQKNGKTRGRGPNVNQSTMLIGHIVIDEKGVRWRAHVGAPKLALMFIALLGILMVYRRPGRARSLSW